VRRLAPAEREYIQAAPPALARLRFLEIWTKKEAYLKYRGPGLAAGLKTFSVMEPEPLGITFTSPPAVRTTAPDLIAHLCHRPGDSV
jgi:hypothetical protein